MIIEIDDEEIIAQLEDMVEDQQRPLEAVLRALIAAYPMQPPPPSSEEALRRYRVKVYRQARQYWKEHGDEARASLSNEQLDEQFGGFDNEGIPFLKGEREISPKPGTLGYLAKKAREAKLSFNADFDARDADAILRDEFGQAHKRRMKHSNVPTNSR